MPNASDLTYFDKLTTMINGGKTDVISNEDHSNNADITLHMLACGGHIRMYCGEMSIFRKAFYGHIGEKEGKRVAKEYEQKMVEALTKFFSDPSNRLDIILASQCKLSDIKDLICKDILEEQLNNGRMTIKVVDDRRIMTDMMPHFMLSSKHNMVRIERNPKKHAAHFWVHLPDKAFSEFRQSYEDIDFHSKAIAV